MLSGSEVKGEMNYIFPPLDIHPPRCYDANETAAGQA